MFDAITYLMEKEGLTRDEATEQVASEYRLPNPTTEEDLETWALHHDGTVLRFGDLILLAGYFYQTSWAPSWYAGVFARTEDGVDAEDPIRILKLTEPAFDDNGHAIAWAIEAIQANAKPRALRK